MSVKKLLQQLSDLPNAEVSMTEKQLSIISAAIEIFSEKGFASTSTSEIAQKANVAEGTIFRHYKTKKDLLLTIPDYVSKLPVSKNLLKDINTIIRDPDAKFEDLLHVIIQNRKNFATANMTLIKVLFQELPFHPELRVKLLSLLVPIMKNFAEAIDVFKERGQIIDLPTSTIVNLIISSMMGYIFTHYVIPFEQDWDHEKEIEQFIRYIMNGIGKSNQKG
ncbi:TetR/AcrR family transcriptional regulator [Bacillus sp. FJAT-29790]|uniref:TetR/AcrR family transcriptional regulator n=1 Tax=Bacillus sp. FJAT-29790 TaxID=1895002 RepID=UPI001C237506|nr:TetR/AcrR family transcriptional regulator [Bacillus sp. FJAT-29790]MBU8878511.1 TetR/AcrR family transcriptional regulator [Bacillus sp. FJAT-29790]